MIELSFKKHDLIFKSPAGTSRGVLRSKTSWIFILKDSEKPDRWYHGECSLIQGLSPDNSSLITNILIEICNEVNKAQSLDNILIPEEFPAIQFGIEMLILDYNSENEKILFRKIIADTFIATIDISNYYIDQSLYVAIKYPNTKVDLKYFLGLLNSKLLGFFFKKYYSEDDALFPQIKVNELREIPFKIGKEESKVSKVVSYIMYCSDKSISHQTFFERLNDAIVYELYLPEEINAGGAEVLKHLGNLPELKEGQDEKNLKTIEKVYKELSDPKHPISAALLKLLTIEEINIIEGRK